MSKRTPFNPAYHMSVVENYRHGFVQRFGKPSNLTDESIWNLFEEWYGVVDNNYPDDQDRCTYDAMKEAQDAHDENTKP